MIICNCRNTPGLEEIATLNGVWGVTVVLRETDKRMGMRLGCNKKRKEVTNQVSFAIKKKKNREPLE